MGTYRLELSPNNRAVCKNKECKDNAVKIMKGELRFGTLVDIQGHQSWTYKHWGCVTPLQIGNLQETTGGDTEMVDGYDELPPEYQEKINFALKNGHVPDDDWKGDLECNRPGAKGFRVNVKTPKKKGKKADEEDFDEAPKPTKKRGRAAKDENEEEAPQPKKARAKAKKAAPKEGTPESEVEVPEPKAKKAKGKKAAVKKVVEEPVDELEPEAPKPKRGKKKAAAADVEEKSVPQKRSRKKKAAVEDE